MINFQLMHLAKYFVLVTAIFLFYRFVREYMIRIGLNLSVFLKKLNNLRFTTRPLSANRNAGTIKSTLHKDFQEGVLTLYLNRPLKKNAFNIKMYKEVEKEL